MGGGPPDFPQGFSCLVVLRILPLFYWISCTGLSPCIAGFPKTVPLSSKSLLQSITPYKYGLGSSAFARHYSRNRGFFLFLGVLRCFSSPRSPHNAMDSRYDDRGMLCRVSTFGYLRIDGYLLLPAAFRSLSRPSSALSAQASTLRSF